MLTPKLQRRIYYSCENSRCPSTNSSGVCELASDDGGVSWYNGALNNQNYCAAGRGVSSQFLYATVDDRQPRVGFRTAIDQCFAAILSEARWNGFGWDLAGPF